MDELSMNGIGGAEYVTMKKKTGEKLATGMAVTLTGSNEVGFGVAGGSPVFGIVSRTEKDDFVGVQISGFNDSILITGTVANQPAIGSLAACNDKGELIKMETPPTNTRGIITAVDKTAKSATVLL